MLKKYVELTSIIRGFLTLPIRLLAYGLGVPNFKVLYKSGHVQYLFLASMNVTRNSNSELTSAKWESAGVMNRPLYFGLNEVAAIYELY